MGEELSVRCALCLGGLEAHSTRKLGILRWILVQSETHLHNRPSAVQPRGTYSMNTYPVAGKS